MNEYRPARQFSANLTSKCQVTIPKPIREALGLKAGDKVAFELTAQGDARIVALNREDERAAHKARIMQGVAEGRRLFRPQGMSNQEFYDLMRGPPAEA